MAPTGAAPHLPHSLASHNTPRCPTCSLVMRVLLVLPDEHEDQVTYRCDKCRAEVIRVGVRRAADDAE
jgi:hypothetical protein